MLSRTSEYALRALIHMARHVEDWPMSAGRIADQTGVPAGYLSKILGDLVRAGVLDASRGKRGGFRMARSARATSLWDVVAPFEQSERRTCPFGHRRCSDDDPCLAHEPWKRVLEVRHRFLQDTSVHDVAIKGRDRRGQGSTRKQRIER